MVRNRTRARLERLLVAGATSAVLLAGASSAQAALAGANPLTTTSRPDLRTVTLTGTSTAQFCFDKTINQVPSQSSFSLGGYVSTNSLVSTNPTTIDTANNKCVDATFPVSIGDTDDLSQFTYGQVGESAALTQVGSGLVGNRADSTALSGSNTHNGTRGHTTAPDLTGVVVDNVNTGNTLDYIYDQNVQISTIDATKFRGLLPGWDHGRSRDRRGRRRERRQGDVRELPEQLHARPDGSGDHKIGSGREPDRRPHASTTDSQAVGGNLGVDDHAPRSTERPAIERRHLCRLHIRQAAWPIPRPRRRGTSRFGSRTERC